MKEPLSPLQIAVYAINCINSDYFAGEVARMITDYASEVAREAVKLAKYSDYYQYSDEFIYTEQEILEKLKL